MIIPETPGHERRMHRINVFLPVAAMLFALVASQGYFVREQLRNTSRLQAMEYEAAAYRDRMASSLAEAHRARPQIEKEKQMAVDLTLAVVDAADEGNPTARAVLPALRSDLQQLQLKINLGGGSGDSSAGGSSGE